MAQQYMDELYDWEGTNDGKMEDDLAVPQQSPSGLPFYSSVDVSLGSGEVNISLPTLFWIVIKMKYLWTLALI